jgi:hypothetical protein
MIRVARVPTASGFSKAAKSCGSFFSRPLESVGRFWDDECPVPPCATHAALKTGIRLRLPLSVPSAAPVPPESVTTPTLYLSAPALPKAEGTPTPLRNSSTCGASRPNPFGHLRRGRGIADENQTGVAAQLLVLRPTRVPFAPAWRLAPQAVTPPKLAVTPGCPEFVAPPSVRMLPVADRFFVVWP